MRKLIFILAAVGLFYLAGSAYSCYRQVFPPPEQTAETTDGAPGAEQGSAGPGFSEGILASPYAGQIRQLAPYFCAPGLFVLTFLSFDPDSIAEWIFAFVFSWWAWGTAIRLAWIVSARIFGFGYSPRAFRYWLLLVPPWRFLYGLIRPVIRWLRFLTFGRKDTDRWASLPELLYHVFRSGKLLLGRFAYFGLGFLQPLGIRAQRHVAMIAAPGSGKSVQLATIIHAHRGAVVVTDCDGQLITATGRRKAALGMKVIKLDPFNLAPDFECADWNVFTEIDDAVMRHGEAAAVEWAATIAEALIKTPAGGAGVNEWVYQEARVVMLGLILYVWKYAPPERRNLVYLRKLLTLGQREKARSQDDPLEVLIADMMIREDFDGVIAASGSMLRRSMGGKGEGKSPVLATLIEQTAWLDLPRMAAISKHSDLHCHDVQRGEACVYLVAPTVDLQGKLSNWNRLLTNVLLYTFQRATGRPRYPALFCCDEYPNAQANNPMILNMSGVGRKYKVQLLIIAQTITQLKAVHPQNWSDFLGTADAVIWMATGDQPTLEHLSNILGSRTQAARVSSGILSPIRDHLRREDRKLMSAGQLREWLGASNNIIVTRADSRPMKLKAEPYFKAVPVRWYDADKFHKETRPRAFTRRILALFTGRRRALPPAQSIHPTTREKRI